MTAKALPPAGTPVFDSRPVLFAAGLLVALYAALLAGAWAQGFTVLGSRDLVTRDFSVFWGAGRLALAGRPAAAYSWADLQPLLVTILGRPSEPVVKTFFYPPVFFLMLAPLAALPYAAAAMLWLGGTLAVYLAAIRAILPGGTALLAALAAPAVLFNLIAGQNGLLTAGLLGAGLALLDARPLVAGALIGLVCYKPHFGLLVPLLLALTGRWTVFAAAAGTVAGLIGLSLALFGWSPFAAFAATLAGFVHGSAQTGPAAAQIEWARLASPYALLRALGLGGISAGAVQLAIAAVAAAATALVSASRASDSLKAATLLTATVLVTPYSELTDLAILTVAIAFVVRDGIRRPDEAAILAAVFLLPLLLLAVPGLGRLAGLSYTAALAGPLGCALLAMPIARRCCR